MELVTDRMFWATIEDAWTHAEGRWDGMTARVFRQALFAGDFAQKNEAFDTFLVSLQRELRLHYGARKRFGFLELFRTKVVALDYAELAMQIASDDDEFVAARHCAVAMGEKYYDAARLRPTTALVGCFVPWFESELRFRMLALGRTPLPPSRVNVATGANAAGWPTLHTPELSEARTRAATEALWSRLGPGSDARIASLGVPPTTRVELEAAIVQVADRIRARENAGAP